MTEVFQQIMEFVKEASSVVWGVYRAQVFVQALQLSIWGWFAVIVFVFTNEYRKRTSDRENKFWAAVLEVVLAFIIVFVLACVIGQLMNPDYYAIQLLISTFK